MTMSAIARVYRLTPPTVFVLYLALDVFCMGMGMGVPIFNIVFGFIVGWYLVRWVSIGTREAKHILQRLLIYSCVSAGVTFLGMVLIWGWSLTMLYDPHADLANFGIPQILFAPRMSFIAWLVLMIVISPFLQLLTTVFGGHLAMLSWYRKDNTLRGSAGATS